MRVAVAWYLGLETIVLDKVPNRLRQDTDVSEAIFGADGGNIVDWSVAR